MCFKGGLISQNVLSIDKNSQKVNTIITLATPNKNPIATLDQLIPKFYAETFRYWESNLKNDYPNNKVGSKIYSKENSNNNSLSNILFITIGGGSRDILVPSGLTSSKFGHINTLVSSSFLVLLIYFYLEMMLFCPNIFRQLLFLWFGHQLIINV